jgi:Concanavalin A-like lectin/glucanases superfamily
MACEFLKSAAGRAIFCAVVGVSGFMSAASAQANLFGNALDLNGVDQHVAIPANALIGSQFTVEAWVKVRAHADWGRLLETGNGPDNDNVLFALSTGGTGQPILRWYNGGALVGDLLSPTTLPLNVWTHLAFTCDGTNAAIVMNGNVVASGAFTPPNSLLRSSNFVGRSLYAGDAYANAQIEEFRIWSVARSTNFIQAAMNTALPGDEGDLLLYYPFDETSGTTNVNRAKTTGAALNGTPVNGPTNFPSALYAPIPPVRTLNYYPMGEAEGGIVGIAATSTVDVVMGNDLQSTSASTNRPRYSDDVPSDPAAGSTRSLEFLAGPFQWQDAPEPCYGDALFNSTLTDNFGLECWVKFATAFGERFIVYNGVADNYQMNVPSSGFGIFQGGDHVMARFGWDAFFGYTPIVTGVWTHLAIVRDNGIATFYVNGEPVGSTTVPPRAVSDWPSLLGGADFRGFAAGARPEKPTTYNFAGKIDELRLFTFFPGTFRPYNLRVTTHASITSTKKTPAGALLGWSADRGPFVVQTATQVADTAWTTLTNVVVTDNLATLVAPVAGAQAFYRLVSVTPTSVPACTSFFAPPQLSGRSSIHGSEAVAYNAAFDFDLTAPPMITAQSSCTNAAFTYRWRLSPSSPNVSGWNTPTLHIPGGSFGEGFVTFWLDVTDSHGETRTFSRTFEFFSGGGVTPPDA